MELFHVKLLVLVLTGVVRILCGMLPLVIVKMIKRRWSKSADRRLRKCISVLVFFGGGVMLATCFLHMMPEVQEIFNENLPDAHLPIPQFIFVMGFFLVYMMEDIVHAMIHKRKTAKRRRKAEKLKGSSPVNCKNNNVVQIAQPPPMQIAVIGGGKDNVAGGGDYLNHAATFTFDEHHDQNHEHHLFDKNLVRKCDDIPGLPKNRMVSTTNVSRNVAGNNGLIVGVEKFSYIDPEWFRDTVIANSKANGHGMADNESQDVETTVTVISDDSNSSSGGSSSGSGSTSCSRKKLAKNVVEEDDDDHDHHDGHEHGHSHIPVAGDDDLDQTIGAEIRNLLIVIAISFHGVFEGMAIGLQDTVPDVWYMFFAVSLHECTILFCIGVELISNKTKVLRMVLYVLIVSLVSPVGIAIGILVTERTFGQGGVQALVVGSFQGLAAGSLLYVTFFEIFQEEGRKLHRKYIHILVALLGFVMMGALEFLGGHGHGGSKGGPSGGHSHGSSSSSEALDGHDHSDEGHNHTLALTGYHIYNDTDSAELEHLHHHHDHHDHEH